MSSTNKSEENENKEKEVVVKHGNPFAAAFKGTLGKGLGCFVIFVIVMVVLFEGCDSGGDRKVAVSDETPHDVESEEGVVKAEVVKTHWEAYTNTIGTNWAIVTAIIKNTGSTNVRLSEASGSLYNADGKVVGNGSEHIYPEIIAPGEETYVAVQMMDTVRKSEIADAKIQFSYEETSKEPIKVNAVNDAGRRTKYDYVVTGELENPTDNEITEARALILFYDTEGNLINVETAYPEPDTIPPHGRVSFKGTADHLEDLIKNHRVVGYSNPWFY